MQSICRSALRRPSVFPVTFGTPCRHPSAFARRDPIPLKSALPALPDELLAKLNYAPQHLRHSIGVRSEEKQVKLDWTTKNKDILAARKDAFQNVNDYNLTAADDIYHVKILKGSSHRDGAIYKKNWEDIYDMDIADRNETDPDLKIRPSKSRCYPDQENCISHWPDVMMQVFWLRLAKTPINNGSIQLYGYMAARDDFDGQLNYVFNRSRDDPISVQEGSLIQMTGPKRGIVMLSEVLFEFDMRIKTGDNEENDIQLIDGLIHYNDRLANDTPFNDRISGNCGAVDMSFAAVELGLEARIEIAVSEVQRAFNLSVSSFVYIGEVPKKVELFHGTAGEMVIRSVVVVPFDTTMHLKFSVGRKGSDSDASLSCSLGAKMHGCTHRQIKLDMACISIKVAWGSPFY